MSYNLGESLTATVEETLQHILESGGYEELEFKVGGQSFKLMQLERRGDYAERGVLVLFVQKRDYFDNLYWYEMKRGKEAFYVLSCFVFNCIVPKPKPKTGENK